MDTVRRAVHHVNHIEQLVRHDPHVVGVADQLGEAVDDVVDHVGAIRDDIHDKVLDLRVHRVLERVHDEVVYHVLQIIDVPVDFVLVLVLLLIVDGIG